MALITSVPVHSQAADGDEVTDSKACGDSLPFPTAA